MTTDNSPTVFLVPGFWLGGWAWDAVAERLARDGLLPVRVTLPGLDSLATPREGITLADHVGAIVDAVRGATSDVVLVAHSGAGMLATAVLDQAPDLVSQVVYVDSGPVADGTIARPDLDSTVVDVPLPTLEELEAGGASLAGLTDEMLERFKTKAVANPAGPLRAPVRLTDPRRNEVPATIVCCSMPGAVIREMAKEGGMFAPLADLTNVKYVDLPTGHWPMWSEPGRLAEILEETAQQIRR